MDLVLAAAGFQGCPIPSRRMVLDDEVLVAELIDRRRADHATFGSTPPFQGSIRLPAEFEAKSELHLVFPGWLEHEDFFFDLVAATWQEGRVHVHLMHPEDRWHVRRLASERGIPPHAMQVHSGWPVESIWIRDFGPMAVEVDQRPALVDWVYALDCMDDDALPTRMASAWEQPIARPALVLDGGNLSTDGQGTCFTTTGLTRLNGLSAEELETQLRDYLGCRQLVVLEPLAGNVIDHVDQLLAVGEQGVLLLAAPDPRLDPDNAERMARNRLRLEALERPEGGRFRVVEVPMPPPGLVEGDLSQQGPMVLSYLNLLPFNEVVVVPGFGHADSQELALQRIAEAFPQRRLEVVSSLQVAEGYGAVHCVSLTLP